LAWDQGEAPAAEKLLGEAAGLAGAEALNDGFKAASYTAADALTQLATVYGTQVRPFEMAAAATAALAYSPLDPGLERGAATIEALAQAMLQGSEAGLQRFALRLPARAEDVEVADVDPLAMRGVLHYFAGHVALGIADLRAATRLARHGPALQLPRAHLHLAELLFDAGEWDEAVVQGHVALSLLSDERRTWVEAQAYANLSWVPASRGQWQQAEEQLRKAEKAAAEMATSESRSATLLARGTLARAKDDAAAVVEAVSLLEQQLSRQSHVKIGTLVWYPWLIAAFIDLGELQDAQEHLARLRAHTADRQLDFSARTIGLEGRLCAAEGRLDKAEANFRQAVALLGPDDPLLDRALLHHAFGRFLSARGDRREGVDQLRKAYDLLVPVGATPFVKRVEDDLALAGIHAPAAAERSALDLTDREGDVASLVAAGLTNKEIAAQLYLSVNTVEYHLRNVFAKLGISSRRQLRGVLVRG
jgi:DNA-binding CsgD family transcriptional regulator/Tfp pilus assembly protein PilF